MRHFSILAVAVSLLARADDITPRVGLIEVYGAHRVSEQKIRNALGAKIGDPLPSREEVEARVAKVPGVLYSHVEAACCNERKMILYVGIEERGEPHVQYHDTPSGSVALPPALIDGYRKLLEDAAASIRGRNADQDLTNGFSLMADPDSRELQLSFLPAVEKNLALVDQVVRQAGDSEQRAAAAYLLQYGPRGPRTNKTIVNGLQYALRDSDDDVRANAVRALQAVAIGAKLHPDQQIQIQPTWFIELMNSIVWTDRRNATLALVDLTEDRDPATLQLLRERALPAVIEMAHWHDLEHALPAFILAGRIAGLDEQKIKATWVAEDRDAILKQALRNRR